MAHLGLGAARECDVVVTLPYGAGTVTRERVRVGTRLGVEARR